MRPIHLAELDKIRPVLVLTRQGIIQYLEWITIAPITSRIRGLTTEVSVGFLHGLDHDSVVNLDNIQTINKKHLLRQIGALRPEDEHNLTTAIHKAFNLL